ncbi:NUDIX hydrolase [Nocardia kruczakiae]|uniref:NUDIX hydrolase n=1 Tax=Nocardia kruczakiae TaxID=261477 RepID=UPI0007A39E1A|nr:NUDIX domain-containing protein [Nocardia kruczakiae]
MDRYRCVVDVHLVLVRGGELLWSRRADTGYADDRLGLVSGHLEEGEDVIDAAIREANEEVGICLRREDLSCAHVMHHRNGSDIARVGFFFRAERWDGDIVNREPRKCSELVWRDFSDIPADAVPYPAAAIRRILAGETFSVHGWGDPAVEVIEYRPQQ